jgi:putative ABC transport system permease protein
MATLRELILRLLATLRRNRRDAQLEEEMQAHLALAAEDLERRGHSHEDALRAAQLQYGGVAQAMDAMRDQRGLPWLDHLWRDVRHGLRFLRRSPTFTIVAILTLALGIGANTAIFAVVYGVLLKPLPYPNADRLVSVGHAARAVQSGDTAITGRNVSPSMYFTYRDESRTFENIGLWSTGGQSVTGVGEPEQVRTLWVTYGALQALGVQPMIGRWFSEADDTPETPGPNPVILTYGYWQRKFGSDQSVLGRVMTIDSRPAQVVGVMPAHFNLFTFDPEIIMTLRLDRRQAALGQGGFHGFARLKPSVTLAEASADMERILPIWLNAWPPGRGPGREVFESWRIAPALLPLKDDVVGNIGEMLWLLMGSIGFVLLIACANIANLMLVRADGRRQEFAVRAALGAGRSMIARGLLVESLLLGVMGGALGLLLSYGALQLLIMLGPIQLPRLRELSIDFVVFAFGLGASLLASLLFGSITALKYSSSADGSLGNGVRGASASRERQAARNILVVVQVALALVLLVSSGLMIRTFQALNHVHSGFGEGKTIQTARIWFPASLAREPERITQVQHEILDRVASVPGVTAAAFASFVPMDGRAFSVPILAEDHTYETGKMPAGRRGKFISPGYFRAMGTRMIAGRDITWGDINGHLNVAIISENLARELWGDSAAAIGKRIREPNSPVWREVVGVVEDVHEDGPLKNAPSMVYWPVLMQDFLGNTSYLRGTPAIVFIVQSERAGSESLINDVRKAVWSVDPNLPLFLINTMQELYDRSIAQTSFALVLLAIAGTMALALGIIGLYAVIAYLVSQRSREIGIRLALGADPFQLKRMFVSRGLALGGIGVAGGLAVAVPLSHLMSSLLFGIGPLDLTTYFGVLGILLTASGVASYMPARHAAMIDPVNTLKAE